MDKISEEIMSKLSPIPMFQFHLFGQKIVITNTIIDSWIIMAIVVIACIFLTRNLQIVPKGPQIAMEALVKFMNNFFQSTIGPGGREYYPYLASVMIFIAVSNLIGFFGVTPPTKDLNVTAGLAIMSIILVQICGIRKKGIGGWLHSFLEPLPLITPINIMELGIKPLSLCMRLFGNVLGSFIVMELLKAVCALIVPVPFSCYFDIFDGLIQAYVFVFLTSMYISESLE